MAALSSEARRLRAAMLCPRQMSSSGSFGDAPAVTGGVPALEHGICGGGDPPAPLLPPPPLPLLQYDIIVSPETYVGVNIDRRQMDCGPVVINYADRSVFTSRSGQDIACSCIFISIKQSTTKIYLLLPNKKSSRKEMKNSSSSFLLKRYEYSRNCILEKKVC